MQMESLYGKFLHNELCDHKVVDSQGIVTDHDDDREKYKRFLQEQSAARRVEKCAEKKTALNVLEELMKNESLSAGEHKEFFKSLECLGLELSENGYLVCKPEVPSPKKYPGAKEPCLSVLERRLFEDERRLKVQKRDLKVLDKWLDEIRFAAAKKTSLGKDWKELHRRSLDRIRRRSKEMEIRRWNKVNRFHSDDDWKRILGRKVPPTRIADDPVYPKGAFEATPLASSSDAAKTRPSDGFEIGVEDGETRSDTDPGSEIRKPSKGSSKPAASKSVRDAKVIKATPKSPIATGAVVVVKGTKPSDVVGKPLLEKSRRPLKEQQQQQQQQMSRGERERMADNRLRKNPVRKMQRVGKDAIADARGRQRSTKVPPEKPVDVSLKARKTPPKRAQSERPESGGAAVRRNLAEKRSKDTPPKEGGLDLSEAKSSRREADERKTVEQIRGRDERAYGDHAAASNERTDDQKVGYEFAMHRMAPEEIADEDQLPTDKYAEDQMDSDALTDRRTEPKGHGDISLAESDKLERQEIDYDAKAEDGMTREHVDKGKSDPLKKAESPRGVIFTKTDSSVPGFDVPKNMDGRTHELVFNIIPGETVPQILAEDPSLVDKEHFLKSSDKTDKVEESFKIQPHIDGHLPKGSDKTGEVEESLKIQSLSDLLKKSESPKGVTFTKTDSSVSESDLPKKMDGRTHELVDKGKSDLLKKAESPKGVIFTKTDSSVPESDVPKKMDDRTHELVDKGESDLLKKAEEKAKEVFTIPVPIKKSSSEHEHDGLMKLKAFESFGSYVIRNPLQGIIDNTKSKDAVLRRVSLVRKQAYKKHTGTDKKKTESMIPGETVPQILTEDPSLVDKGHFLKSSDKTDKVEQSLKIQPHVDGHLTKGSDITGEVEQSLKIQPHVDGHLTKGSDVTGEVEKSWKVLLHMDNLREYLATLPEREQRSSLRDKCKLTLKNYEKKGDQQKSTTRERISSISRQQKEQDQSSNENALIKDSAKRIGRSKQDIARRHVATTAAVRQFETIDEKLRNAQLKIRSLADKNVSANRTFKLRWDKVRQDISKLRSFVPKGETEAEPSEGSPDAKSASAAGTTPKAEVGVVTQKAAVTAHPWPGIRMIEKQNLADVSNALIERTRQIRANKGLVLNKSLYSHLSDMKNIKKKNN